MALSSKALTTLDALESELGVSGEDTYLERLIERASDRFAQACRRSLHREVDIVERVEGYGVPRLVVGRSVESISSIVLITGSTTETIDATTYEIEDADAGFIRRIGGVWGSTAMSQGVLRDRVTDSELALWKVTYTGGYVTPQQAADDGTLTRSLPYDIEDAVLEMCVAAYRSKGKDLSVRSKKLLSGSITYDTSARRMSPSVQAVIDRYREVLL